MLARGSAAAYLRSMSSDPRARLTHEIDQLGGLLADLAPLLGAFRDRLIDAGFTRAEAVSLAHDLLLEMYREARESE